MGTAAMNTETENKTREIRLDITEILERCLLDIDQGKNIHECIANYSEYPELGLLLRAATLLQGVEGPPMPASQAHLLEQRLLGQFQKHNPPSMSGPSLDHVRDEWAPAVVPSRLQRSIRTQRASARHGAMVFRWFLAACATLVVLFVGAGLVDAASSALPGDNLYGLKRTVEQIDLQLSASQEARDQIYTHMAEQRLFEGTLLVLQNKPLDSGFITDTNAIVSAVLSSKLLPDVPPQLVTRAGFFAQLIKQQYSEVPGMRQLATMLDRLTG